MGCVVNAGQVLEIKMGINLRRGDVGMAEELLYATQFSARFKQVRGEGVRDEVGMDLDPEPLTAAPVGDSILHGAAAQAPPVAAEKKRIRVGLSRGKLCQEGALLEPSRQGLDCFR